MPCNYHVAKYDIHPEGMHLDHAFGNFQSFFLSSNERQVQENESRWQAAEMSENYCTTYIT